jgi:hypothetical protein
MAWQEGWLLDENSLQLVHVAPYPHGGPERQVKIRVVGRQRIVAYQHPDNAESPEPRNKKQSKDAQRHGSVCHHNSECAWSMLLKPTTSEPSPLLIGYDWWWLLGGMPG